MKGKFSWHYGADPETNRIINNQTPTITQLDQPGEYICTYPAVIKYTRSYTIY